MSYSQDHCQQESEIQNGVYMSPIVTSIKNCDSINLTNKSRNKENCNIQNDITQLLKSYQPCKKKISLPANSVSSKQPRQILEDLFNQIKTKKSSSSKSKRNSTSPLLTKQKKQHFLSQNNNLELSPIYKNEVLSPKVAKTANFKCTYHQNKKAKFFNFKEKGKTVLYCSDCSMKKLIHGNLLYPVDSLMNLSDYNRQQQSESGLNKVDGQQFSSITRTNFWSVDENSLLSSLGGAYERQKYQNTFNSCCDEEYFIKEKELQDFVLSVKSLKEKCINIVGQQKLDEINICSLKLNKLQEELSQILNLIKLQSIKLIKTLQNKYKQQFEKQEVIRKVSDIERDLQNIMNDIAANKDNIINNMQLQPFRQIIEKYNEKLSIHNSQLSNCLIQSEAIQTSFELVQQQIMKLMKVKKMFCCQFQFDQTQLIDRKENEYQQITHRNPCRSKLIGNAKLNDNVYISFENKDLFMAAQRGSMQISDQQGEINKIQQLETDMVLIESPDEQRMRRNIIDSPNFLK